MTCTRCDDRGYIDLRHLRPRMLDENMVPMDNEFCDCDHGVQLQKASDEQDRAEKETTDEAIADEWREAFHEWVMDRIYATTRMTDVDKIYEKAFNIGLNAGRGVSPKADEYLLRYLLETGVIPGHLRV